MLALLAFLLLLNWRSDCLRGNRRKNSSGLVQTGQSLQSWDVIQRSRLTKEHVTLAQIVGSKVPEQVLNSRQAGMDLEAC